MRGVRFIAITLVLASQTGVAQLGSHAVKDEDGVYRAGYGGTPTPRLLQKAPVVYPVEDSRPLNRGCTVFAVIDPHGKPNRIRVVRSVSPAADEAAVEAVRESKYGFGVYKGDPVSVAIEVWVPFLGNHWAGPIEMLPLDRISEGASILSSPPAETPGPGHSPTAEGSVAVSVLVLDDGIPALPFVVRSLGPQLDQAALELVRRYRFKPAVRDGMPVPQRITVEPHVSVY